MKQEKWTDEYTEGYHDTIDHGGTTTQADKEGRRRYAAAHPPKGPKRPHHNPPEDSVISDIVFELLRYAVKFVALFVRVLLRAAVVLFRLAIAAGANALTAHRRATEAHAGASAAPPARPTVPTMPPPPAPNAGELRMRVRKRAHSAAPVRVRCSDLLLPAPRTAPSARPPESDIGHRLTQLERRVLRLETERSANAEA